METQEDRQRGFRSFIEVQPLEGCKLDPEDAAGAFTHAFIPAPSFFAALNSLLMSLKNGKFQLINLESLSDSTAFDWPNATLELVQEARDAGTVVFDTFNSYPHDEVEEIDAP